MAVVLVLACTVRCFVNPRTVFLIDWLVGWSVGWLRYLQESQVARLVLLCVKTRVLDCIPKAEARSFLAVAFNQPSVVAYFNRPQHLARLQSLCRDNMQHIDRRLADMVVAPRPGMAVQRLSPDRALTVG